ncbi:beta-microseminoprotein-like isoform X2 [Rhinoderma darwinii]|uniref:beta-microseminoprotein-like isoform X2 n=1 Tax=Rhinoderma darwinii TaxID=43563 RepID=UPI003F678E70
MMKYLLVIAFFGTGILVGVCNAACSFLMPSNTHMDGDPGSKLTATKKGCINNGDIHEYGSNWRTEDCMDCSCYADGSMRCCTAFGTPANYNKEKCIAIFDKEACAYSVVRKKNRNINCKHALVG